MRPGLVLLDGESGWTVPAVWAGHLLGLGARLARRLQRDGWQLVVAVSVPIRDYAALLISAGWILAQPPVTAANVLALAEAIPAGTPVRMATPHRLVADRFFGIDGDSGEARMHVGASYWKIDAVGHIVADPTLPRDRFGKAELAPPGSLVTATGHGDSWAADVCAAQPTVIVVGVQSRLNDELELHAGWPGRDGGYDRLGDVLRPDDGQSAFCASAIASGGRDRLPEVPAQVRLAVLDGASAIRWLPEIRSPLVVALIDRGSADESAGLTVLQRRSTSTLIELSALGWGPLAGMEALAFEARI